MVATMKLMQQTINFEVKGTEEFEKSVCEWSPRATACMIRWLEILKENGTNLKEPHAKPLVEKMWELRYRFERERIRLIYFIDSHRNIVLLFGFVKKTQKTPKECITAARLAKQAYERADQGRTEDVSTSARGNPAEETKKSRGQNQPRSISQTIRGGRRANSMVLLSPEPGKGQERKEQKDHLKKQRR